MREFEVDVNLFVDHSQIVQSTCLRRAFGILLISGMHSYDDWHPRQRVDSEIRSKIAAYRPELDSRNRGGS